MKKQAVAAVAAATCAVMAFAFTACSTADKAKSMKSEEVSQEQWTAFFDPAEGTTEALNNVRVELAFETTEESYTSGVYKTLTATGEMTIVIADTIEYISQEGTQKGKYGEISLDDEAPFEESYSIKNTDGTYTMYEKNAAGVWETSTGTTGVGLITLALLLADLSTSYESYVFSDDRGGYVLSDDYEGEGYVLKFDEEGRLAAVWQESETVGTSSRTSSRLAVTLEYGGQSVTLPEVGSN